MRKALCLLFLCSIISDYSFSQNSGTNNSSPGVFDKIAKQLIEFQLDTSSAPDDKITRKIIELRDLRGGFNINDAIEFKIAEDRQKNQIPKVELDALSAFFKTGNGKKWLDNAMTWIYRKTFNYRELKQLVKFYKTDAGQKMSAEFPVIMLQSLRAAEMIKEAYEKQQKLNNCLQNHFKR